MGFVVGMGKRGYRQYLFFAGKKALFYMNHHITRSHEIPSGIDTRRVENVLRTEYVFTSFFRFRLVVRFLYCTFFDSYLPIYMVVGLMDSDEMLGSTDKSNFQFGHHDVKQLYFTSGAEIFPNPR